MTLTTGARLGAYEIVAPLGAGGMGEVYRARDTRLDRTVALKVLPDRFAERSDLRERFEREARVVSNLNHPNICTLYDVGREGNTAYFVMEYLDGQSLSDRLAKGPLPLDQALRYAIDIADALTKAHRHGIIHRDLKPANIMLTKSGAKLLDFGLARRYDAQPVVMPDAPTVHGAPLTGEGTILGTLQYMSPEQLEGRDLDARSDIFSFGAVLYEMVTGRRAFDATSHASLISKIMSEEPRAVREIAPVTPERLERLIHRCLAKDPDARWQCAGDLVTELRSATTVEQTPSARRTRPLFWIAAVAALAIVATILGAMLLRRPAAPAADAVRFSINTPGPDVGLYFNPLSSQFAVSPDGRHVAFLGLRSGRRYLWVRSLDDHNLRWIESTADAIAPFWSPDSSSIGYFAKGNLLSVALGSGVPQTITKVVPGGAYAGAWAPDGTIVFTELATEARAVYTVPSSGGTPKTLFTLNEVLGIHYPAFLSDGRRFLFTGVDDMSPSLWVGSLDGDKPKRIASEISHVNFVAPYVVYARDGVAVAQRFDERKLELTGPAVPLVAGVQVYWPIGASAHAAGGQTLVTFPYGAESRLVRVDREGRDEDIVDTRAEFSYPRVSPDGRKVATVVTDRKTGIGALWMVDVSRKTMSRITVDALDHERPIWSPDGKRIVFGSDVGGPPHLFIQNVGDMQAKELLPVGNLQQPRDWIEGDRIFYSENRGATRSDIFIVSPADKKPRVWLATPFNEWEPRVSPDRKWIAFTSDQTGGPEIYVAPMDEPGNAIRLTSSGGRMPAWNPDGKEIYFLQPRREIFAIPLVIEGTALDARAPYRVYNASGDVIDYDVGPDGTFLVARADSAAEVQSLDAIVHWQRLLEKGGE